MSLTETRFQPLNILNLRRHIEGQVRAAILNGTFRPGERLVESAIADQLGVSRAPVREVLSALEREGLVVNHPRRGNFVVDFTEKDIEEIYSLRLLLEVGALERAMAHFGAGVLAEMQELVDRLGDLTSRGGAWADIIAVDHSFHDCICRTADHRRLHGVWNGLRVQTHVLMGLTSRTRYDYTTQPRDYHQAILDAIRLKDLGCARAVLTDHIEDAQRRALEALRVVHEQEAVRS